MSAEVGSLVSGPSSRRWRNRQFLSSLHFRVSLGGYLTPLRLLAAGLLVIKVLDLRMFFSLSFAPTAVLLLGVNLPLWQSWWSCAVQ